MGSLKVVHAGALCTIQDQGRFGFRQFGIPQSGAMDPRSMRAANSLVGNSPGSAVIEFAMERCEFEVEESTTVAITGAKTTVRVNGEVRSGSKRMILFVGDKIEIEAPESGVYSYLAMEGEIQATEDFGSKSTYLMAGFGGIEGKGLENGDIIISKVTNQNESSAIEIENVIDVPVQEIRIFKGPEWSMLKDFPGGREFKVSPSSNRMGIRLTGDPLDLTHADIKSSAVIPGTIQLPPDGLPIILMNDCQVTGGYPRIGKVVDEDLGVLAQVRPSLRIRFEVVEAPSHT